jgi:hypothetical protein
LTVELAERDRSILADMWWRCGISYNPRYIARSMMAKDWGACGDGEDMNFGKR